MGGALPPAEDPEVEGAGQGGGETLQGLMGRGENLDLAVGALKKNHGRAWNRRGR